MKTKTSRKVQWAAIIGTGVAIAPVHNQWLTRLFTTADGNTLLFLPAYGYLILIMGVGVFLVNHWKEAKEGLADKKVVVPMLVIVCAMGLSGIPEPTLGTKLAPLLTGLCFCGLYLATRALGSDVWKPLGIGAFTASVGVGVHALVFPGQVTGGFMFEGNYDVVVGYIVLGVVTNLSRSTWSLVLTATGVCAIFLTGSPEGIFVAVVLAVALVLRRDYGPRLAYVIGGLVVLALVWFAMGWGRDLYGYALNAAADVPSSATTVSPQREPVSYRFQVIRDAMANVTPLGGGLKLTEFRTGIVHNVPLILIQQLGWAGIAAAAAWLALSVYMLVKTKYSYPWVAVLALSVFDHFTWTQMAPVWWMLPGLAVPAVYAFRPSNGETGRTENKKTTVGALP